MMVIGRYLLLFISLTGLSLSIGDRFSEEDIDKFLDYIFILHNGVRYKHDVPLFARSYEMNVIATQKMDDVDNNRIHYNEPYGINDGWMYYDDNTQLDSEEAMKFFSLWYEQGNFYNYTREPEDHRAVEEFTQIVWRTAEEIGLTFKCEENHYRVLVIYKPYGNLIGQYTMNVKWPRSDRHVWNPEYIHLYYKTEKEKFIDNLLKLHNNARTKHRVPLLTIDNDLTSLANTMLMCDNNPKTIYGENRFTFTYTENTKLSDEATAIMVFSWWYDAVRYYNYEMGQSSTHSDEFTQIVWNATQWIGIDVHEKVNGQYKVLVLYEPRGNIPDQYTLNVFKPGRSKKDQGGSSRNN